MSEKTKKSLVIVGGGAAGYFAAITAAESHPKWRVTLLEGTRRPLTKVKISGGGRCNVTHHCFDPAELVKSYPRGSRELRGPFSRFQPQETVAWFARRGVKLKTEDDGRMFPVTDSSQTVIDCLTLAAQKAGVTTELGTIVTSIKTSPDPSAKFVIETREKQIICDAVVLATGSAPFGYKIAASLGHTITPLAPSLFSFVIDDGKIKDLAGISFLRVHAELRVSGNRFKQEGPLLITHWGLSGPAILKLSAFAAHELQAEQYQAELFIRWLGPEIDAMKELERAKAASPHRAIGAQTGFDLPSRFWQRLIECAAIDAKSPWREVSTNAMRKLAELLSRSSFHVSGKGEFKSEFVTAGGVKLSEVNFKTMESKICPGLYFAGEILDIDGITGGFNFQNAWTTGWIAGTSCGS